MTKQKQIDIAEDLVDEADALGEPLVFDKHGDMISGGNEPPHPDTTPKPA